MSDENREWWEQIEDVLGTVKRVIDEGATEENIEDLEHLFGVRQEVRRLIDYVKQEILKVGN